MAKNLFLAVIFSSICVLYAENADTPFLVFTKPGNPIIEHYKASRSPSMQRMDETENIDLLRNLKQFNVEKILLLADGLSVNTFRSRDDNHKIVMADLQKNTIMDYRTFAPYAEQAALTLGASKVFLTPSNDLSEDITPETFSIVTLERVAGEEDYSYAYRLNQIIAELSNKYPRAVFILASHKSGDEQKNSRKKRAVDDDKAFKYSSKNLLFYVKEVYAHTKKDDKKSAIQITSVTATSPSAGLVQVSISSEHPIEMELENAGQTWYAKTIKVSGVLVPNTKIYAPVGFSFACASSLYFKINHTEFDGLSFNGLQFQPQFEGTEDLKRFGDAYDCVGFTRYANRLSLPKRF